LISALNCRGTFKIYNEAEANRSGYSETSICLNVLQIGSTEIPAIIHQDTVYVSVVDFFNFLKIKNIVSPGFDSVSIFYTDPEETFIIDKVDNAILYNETRIGLGPNDLLQQENNLYLRLDYFNTVFRLNCLFSFRSLSMKLETSMELPAVRIMKQEIMRKNINILNEVISADTTIGITRPFFKLGTADWALTTMHSVKGQNDTRANLALGAVIAGGETDIMLNYFSNIHFNEKQQFYLWRYVNNDNKGLKQVTAGKIFTQATSSINNPVVGVQFTSAASTLRRSFSSYTISDIVAPGSIVELYLNNVLIGYTRADASGLYHFEVPLIYGNSVVKLRFYGPWGEERQQEREVNISIPFDFLPPGELEYTASAGIVEDNKNSLYSRASFNYGLNKLITTGAGMEYLSSVTSGNYMPFVNTSIRLASNLLLSADYTYGVRARSIVDYRLLSNIDFIINYTRYTRGQTAIIFDYLEERKAIVSVPFHNHYLSGLSRLTVDQIILPGMKSYTTGEWFFSTTYKRVGININNSILLAEAHGDAPYHGQYIYTDLSLALRLTKGLTFSPQMRYSYTEDQFISMRYKLEQLISHKGMVNISYERNFSSQVYSVIIGMQYDLHTAKVGMNVMKYNNDNAVMAFASGSLNYDHETNYFGVNSRTAMGKGGITFLSYLDLNGNNKRDVNEPKVQGLIVHIKAGRIVYDNQDTLIRVFDLEPYTNYFADLSQNTFENITWQVHYKTLNISVMPNQSQIIEIPVTIKREVSGNVYSAGNNELKDKMHIKVCFYRKDSSLAGFTYTETDGSFDFAELSPGSYIAELDKEQLGKLQMNSTPPNIAFTINSNENEEMTSGIDFIINKKR